MDAPDDTRLPILVVRPAQRRLTGWLGAVCASTSVALFVMSCHNPVAPPLPTNAVRVVATPAVYETLWAMTEACAGVTAPLGRIAWYVVPGTSTVPFGQRHDVVGYWTSEGDVIVLAGGAALDGGAVRHEMLHALLRVGTHPRREFLDRCGGTVDCGRDCVADAGPAPSIDPTATVIAPSQLKLSIAVAPGTPATRIDDGFFSVMALATDVVDHPVVVRLPNSSSSTLGVSYT